MDTRTGQIYEVPDGTKLKPWQVELGNKPKENCRKCYGRGHLGRDMATQLFIPCPCTNPKKRSLP